MLILTLLMTLPLRDDSFLPPSYSKIKSKWNETYEKIEHSYADMVYPQKKGKLPDEAPDRDEAPDMRTNLKLVSEEHLEEFMAHIPGPILL